MSGDGDNNDRDLTEAPEIILEGILCDECGAETLYAVRFGATGWDELFDIPCGKCGVVISKWELFGRPRLTDVKLTRE